MASPKLGQCQIVGTTDSDASDIARNMLSGTVWAPNWIIQHPLWSGSCFSRISDRGVGNLAGSHSAVYLEGEHRPYNCGLDEEAADGAALQPGSK